MKIIQSDNILNDQNFAFDQSELTLSMSDREIINDQCVGISYLFQNNSEYEFKNFIHFFLKYHIEKKAAQSLSLIFSNRFIENRSRIRSYQKLFYKEEDLIGLGHFTQAEFDVSDKQSILLGSIKLSEKNSDYCLDRLYTSIFTFGLCTNIFIETLSESFLEKTKEDFLEISDMRYFNPLKTFVGLVDYEPMLFRIALHGNDDQSFDILIHKSLSSIYLELIKEYTNQERRIVYN